MAPVSRATSFCCFHLQEWLCAPVGCHTVLRILVEQANEHFVIGRIVVSYSALQGIDNSLRSIYPFHNLFTITFQQAKFVLDHIKTHGVIIISEV